MKFVLFVEGHTEKVLGSFLKGNFDEPPAKLLGSLYREKLGRSYKKVIDGSNLFQTLAPDAVVEKCPYLKRMLDEMLELARG